MCSETPWEHILVQKIRTCSDTLRCAAKDCDMDCRCVCRDIYVLWKCESMFWYAKKYQNMFWYPKACRLMTKSWIVRVCVEIYKCSVTREHILLQKSENLFWYAKVWWRIYWCVGSCMFCNFLRTHSVTKPENMFWHAKVCRPRIGSWICTNSLIAAGKKRRTYVKRDLFVWKETYTREKRPIWPTYMWYIQYWV